MSDEPEYLRRLRENQQRQRAAAGGASRDAGTMTVQEKEAVKWAREAAGTDLRAVRNLGGAKYAVLLRVQSATGQQMHSLEGLPSREALMERLRPGSGMGEEILAAYEVRGGRPIELKVEGSELKLITGAPRPGANPLPPEKMLRKAAADAEVRAKTRPREDDRGGGRRRPGR